jgi:predicted dehydrogenase
MSKLGIALVGLGPGAQPHLQSLSELQYLVNVRWAVCRNISAADVGSLKGKVELTSNLGVVLADNHVHIVLVATPASTHLDIAAQCLAAGKHVLVEKPLDISLARAEKLVLLGQQSGKCLGVVLQHRFRPGAVRLRQALESGDLGELQSAALSVPWWRSQAGYYDKNGRGTRERDGGGVLLTQAIHAIDLFRSLVGVASVDAAKAITTRIHQIETEDMVTALLTLGNGAPGSLWATTAQYPGYPERIEMIFEKASVSLTGGQLDIAFHDGRHECVQAEGKSGSGDCIMDFSHEAHQALMKDFVEAVHSGRKPLASGEEALATHRLIDRILEVSKGFG